MDLNELIQQQITQQVIESLSKSANIGNSNNTQIAVDDAISILLNGLNRNTSNKEGTSSLGSALERDHDGSILNDLVNIILGKSTVNNNRSIDGEGIIEHILGKKKGGAAEILAEKAGINIKQAINILIKVAPIIMAVLGSLKKKNQVETRGLPDILSQATKNRRTPSGGGWLDTLFDRDGDGRIDQEVKNFGWSFLRSLFSRK